MLMKCIRYELEHRKSIEYGHLSFYATRAESGWQWRLKSFLPLSRDLSMHDVHTCQCSRSRDRCFSFADSMQLDGVFTLILSPRLLFR
jgi:hypothetical protein